MTAANVDTPAARGTTWQREARRLAGVTAAGALLGLLVGGVGGRLAMLLLARLNPGVSGVTSDDGFTIGQFTVATLNLLIVGTLLGVLGSGIYVVLRGLMIGPRWFEVLSISVGPAVVVGSQLVHTDGVDFTLLNPPLLAIGLFVLIPGVYAALLTILGERWLAEDGPFARSGSPAALAPLVLWVPLFPVVLAIAAGYLTRQALQRSKTGAALVAHPAWPWLGRAALTVLFVLALMELVDETTVLV